MTPFAFFTLAEWLFDNKKSPEGFRSVVSRGYYAALHTALSLLSEMGVSVPRDANKHAKVPDLLEHTGDPDVRKAAAKLSNLCQERNKADYQLQDGSAETPTFAELRLRDASDIIATLQTFKLAKGAAGGRFEKAAAGAKKQADFLFRGGR
jgi:uncharacterized protein (UPF0332 family)